MSRETFSLRLFERLKLVKTYRIAVGRAGLETPAGFYTIDDKQVNPSWHVPLSSWAGDLAGRVIPPGPDDPIKSRWMGFYNGAGIHGTDDDLFPRNGRLARLHPDGDPGRRPSCTTSCPCTRRSTSGRRPALRSSGRRRRLSVMSAAFAKLSLIAFIARTHAR